MSKMYAECRECGYKTRQKDSFKNLKEEIEKAGGQLSEIGTDIKNDVCPKCAKVDDIYIGTYQWSAINLVEIQHKYKLDQNEMKKIAEDKRIYLNVIDKYSFIKSKESEEFAKDYNLNFDEDLFTFVDTALDEGWLRYLRMFKLINKKLLKYVLEEKFVNLENKIISNIDTLKPNDILGMQKDKGKRKLNEITKKHILNTLNEQQNINNKNIEKVIRVKI